MKSKWLSGVTWIQLIAKVKSPLRVAQGWCCYSRGQGWWCCIRGQGWWRYIRGQGWWWYIRDHFEVGCNLYLRLIFQWHGGKEINLCDRLRSIQVDLIAIFKITRESPLGSFENPGLFSSEKNVSSYLIWSIQQTYRYVESPFNISILDICPNLQLCYCCCCCSLGQT